MRRSALECSMSVLEEVRTPKILTHIMYASNINSNVLKIILEDLMKKELIRTLEKYRKNYRKHYLISPKGLDLLCNYRRVSETLQSGRA